MIDWSTISITMIQQLRKLFTVITLKIPVSFSLNTHPEMQQQRVNLTSCVSSQCLIGGICLASGVLSNKNILHQLERPTAPLSHYQPVWVSVGSNTLFNAFVSSEQRPPTTHTPIHLRPAPEHSFLHIKAQENDINFKQTKSNQGFIIHQDSAELIDSLQTREYSGFIVPALPFQATTTPPKPHPK